jgi:hypothetical protein
MPKPERYFIGPNVRTKLQQLFDSTPGLDGGGATTIPTRLQNMQRPGGGGDSSIRIGAYSTAGTQWEKGTFKTVNLYEVSNGSLVPKYNSGSPATASVLNLFVTIPPNYDRVRYCAFASVGGTNILMTAEC